MDALASSEVFLFEDFRLDRRGGGLFRRDDDGAFTAVPIGSRGLDILGILIERAGEVVSKDEIVAAVWPGTMVEDSNLTVQISALRRALEHGRPNGRCIQTVPGRGYRFAAPVTPAAAGAPPVASAMRAEAIADLPAPSVPIAAPRHRRAALVRMATGTAAVLVLALGVWWTTKPFPVLAVASAESNPQPLVAPRLSIVVLPFTNLSNDPDQQYFTDGMTDDLTTDLTRITHMFVIARNTAFTYRNKQFAAKAGKCAKPHSGTSNDPRRSRLGLRPRRADRARYRRARRSPQAEPRRPFFQHRSVKGGQKLRNADSAYPRLVREHLLCRPGQGRHAGGVKGSEVAA